MNSRFKVSPKEDRTIDGITFDSKGEMKRYLGLKLAEMVGLINNLSRQTQFDVSINGKHFCTYTADFSYFDVARGTTVHEDVKTTGTAKDAAYRLRKKAAELSHGIKIEEFITGWNPALTKKKKRTRIKKVAAPK